MYWYLQIILLLKVGCVCVCRLLDVQSSEGRFENEHIFYMVFEYMEQDLDRFIKKCPAPGMEEGVVKVR